MSPPPTPPFTRTLRDLPVNKLSPRLLSLLSYSAAELADLVDREAHRVSRVEDEYRQWLRSGANPAIPRPPRWFVPRTAGVFLTTGPWAKPSLEILFDGLPDEPVFSVLIRSEAGRSDLESLGAIVRSHAGDVWSAFVPYGKAPALVKSKLVIFVHLADALMPELADATKEAGIAALHVSSPSMKGRGVWVGVADDVIDLHHPAFQSSGVTRFHRFWDQRSRSKSSGALPSVSGFAGSFAYGVEYTTETIQAELAARYSKIPHKPGLQDTHGTAVLGVAAGNGGGAVSPPAGPGAAPESRLLFVAVLGATASSSLIDEGAATDALTYMFACASADPALPPCVLNLSYTKDLGPHDGHSDWEHDLDALLLAPGRTLTIAAGNHHELKSHKAADVPNGGHVDLELRHVAGAPFDDVLEIWFDGGDDIAVELWFRSDTVAAPAWTASAAPPASSWRIVGPVGVGGSGSGPTDATGVAATEHAKVEVVSHLHAANLDRCIWIEFVRSMSAAGVPNALPGGVWTIRLIGVNVVNGRVDAWTQRHNAGYHPWPAHGAHADDARMTVCAPATARLPIAVGNCRKSAALGDIVGQSGRGTSRDGRYKPEVCAVGHLVFAPLAHDRTQSVSTEYFGFSGTSFSAPLVAGAAALLFECRGNGVTSGEMQQLLADGALARATVKFAGAAMPRDDWGFGPLYVADACAAKAPEVDVWLKKDDLDDGSLPFARDVFWHSPDIELLDRSNVVVANPTYSSTERYNNVVRVTVRNRGQRAATNTEVLLFWADPSTNLANRADWMRAGIFTGSDFRSSANSVTVPNLAPGDTKVVEFGWAPPAPATSASGDGHFCLLAVVDNPGDRSQPNNAGAWIVTDSNNLGQRNVHVQSLLAPNRFPIPRFEPDLLPRRWRRFNLAIPFTIRGDGDWNGLYAFAEGLDAKVELWLPVRAMRWRDGAVLLETGGRRPRGDPSVDDPLSSVQQSIPKKAIRELTDVEGARRLKLRDGFATFTFDALTDRLWIPQLYLHGKDVRACVQVAPRSAKLRAASARVHVGQMWLGKRIGGVTLEIRR